MWKVPFTSGSGLRLGQLIIGGLALAIVGLLLEALIGPRAHLTAVSSQLGERAGIAQDATPTPERWFSFLPLTAGQEILRPPTPVPTRQPTLTGCHHVLSNGSFEDDLENWTVPRSGEDPLPGVYVVDGRLAGISPRHGDKMLALSPTDADRYSVSIQSEEFSAIPRDRFEGVRIGAWIAGHGDESQIGPEDHLWFGIDTDCYLELRGSDAREDWQHLWCEERDPGTYITSVDWEMFIGAATERDPEARPPDGVTWLVDAVSVEICLK